MIEFSKRFFRPFLIEHPEWGPEDESDMKDLVVYPKFKAFKKAIHNRLNARVEDLVNGKDTRSQIEELKDLLLEIQHYENP